MLKFKNVEHVDTFDDFRLVYLPVSGVPEEIKRIAQAIDGDSYEEDNFFVCIHIEINEIFDKEEDNNELFFAVESGEGCELCYSDEEGLTHWMPYVISAEELAACRDAIKHERKDILL